MSLKRYTCKKCNWRFVLDLENNEDTMGRYIDRRTILFHHMVEAHKYKGTFWSFIRYFMEKHFTTEDP